MDFNFKELALAIESATRKAFIEIAQKHKSERIYAFALYSDEGAMTVCPATNTLDFLDSSPKDDTLYYKYEPAEWIYEGDGADDDFSDICSQLFDEVDDEKYYEDELLFDAFQSSLYQTCVDVLLKLKQENFFKDIVGHDIFLMFSVTDFEQDRRFLAETISALNVEPYRTEYLDWLKTWRK